MEIYLDNSATTKPCTSAVEEMMRMLNYNYGNPSSQHALGTEALRALNKSRERVSKAVGCESEELFFAPSGTAANNTAIFGAVSLNKHYGKNIVTTEIEHPSVAEPISQLESKGYNITRIKPDVYGNIPEENIFRAINRNTVLVSIMAVNNEVGSITPLQSIKAAVRRANSSALIHVDAVQAFGKLKLKPSQLGIDLMSVSSHKIHGPKGAGALYIRKGLNLPPYILGGGQEKGIISGTEAMPAIAGFAAACTSLPDLNTEFLRVTRLKDYFLERVKSLPGIYVNSPSNALPYIINISVSGIRSANMIGFLSGNGIYVSAGSACKKGKPSAVLRAMGLPESRTDTALRISLSRFTTFEELDVLFDQIYEGMNTLVRDRSY